MITLCLNHPSLFFNLILSVTEILLIINLGTLSICGPWSSSCLRVLGIPGVLGAVLPWWFQGISDPGISIVLVRVQKSRSFISLIVRELVTSVLEAGITYCMRVWFYSLRIFLVFWWKFLNILIRIYDMYDAYYTLIVFKFGVQTCVGDVPHSNDYFWCFCQLSPECSIVVSFWVQDFAHLLSQKI